MTEFKLAYYNLTAQNINHYTMELPNQVAFLKTNNSYTIIQVISK